MIIFEKTYDDESTYDLPEDVGECFDQNYNPSIKSIPKNEDGFMRGTFKVTIEWIDE